MARYYFALMTLNALFSVVFYIKMKHSGLSLRSFVLISGVSLLSGLIFPVIKGIFNLYVALGANIIFISLGAHFIAGQEGASDKNSEAPIVEENAIEESMEDENAIEEFAEEEIVLRESMKQEIVVEEFIDKETGYEDSITIEEETIELVAAAADSEHEAFYEYNQLGESIMNAPQDDSNDDYELLDSYINRGFEAKFEGKLNQAVKFFYAALELSPPPDLELMLSQDLFSMLRELGQYDRAKDCLNKFAETNYSGLSSSEAIEIKTSLKHLQILKDLLTKANTPELPYASVPVLIKLSAEEKLNSWKNEIF